MTAKTKTYPAQAYKMGFAPILLKEVFLAADISQGQLAETTEVSRATANLCINRGYVPLTRPDFKEKVEALIRCSPRAAAWLQDRGLSVRDIWEPLGRDMRSSMPVGHGKRTAAGHARKPAMIPGDPEQTIIEWEVEMIQQEAMKHFKIFRSPFTDDIQKDSDIFMSDEHRYIEAAMLDAARHGGFLAVIGEVGSGKTTMRKKVFELLRKDGDTLVVFPQIIDKTRLTAASICEAIIMDLSDEKPKIKLEAKSRQVQRLLLDRNRAGYRCCLMIEEAHDLNVQTLKFLKRFYELEDGYRKLLGIVLVGQTELGNMFEESHHPEMREVIRRTQVARIQGLNGNLKSYLDLKFRRIGRNIAEIMTDNAFEALSRRLTSTDGRTKKPISHAYPLLVNNYTARAMNLAWEMGEEKVTAEVIEAI